MIIVKLYRYEQSDNFSHEPCSSLDQLSLFFCQLHWFESAPPPLTELPLGAIGLPGPVRIAPALFHGNLPRPQNLWRRLVSRPHAHAEGGARKVAGRTLSSTGTNVAS